MGKPTQWNTAGVWLRRLFFVPSNHRFPKKLNHVEGNEMIAKKHDGGQSEGSNPRDHAHSRPHFLKRAHRDWRVWVVVVLMLVLTLTYVMTDNLSLRPVQRAIQPTPQATAP